MPTLELMDAVRAAFSEEAVELLRRAEESINRALAAPDSERTAAWLAAMRPLHTLKGSASSMGHTAVADGVHALEEHLRGLVDRPGPVAPTLEHDLLQELDGLRTAVGQALTPVTPAGEAPTEAANYEAEEFLRVRPERIDALHAMAGELVVSRLHQELFAVRLSELRDDVDVAGSTFQRLGARVERLRKLVPAGEWAELNGALRGYREVMHDLSRKTTVMARELPLAQAQSAVVSAALEDSIRELRLMPLQPFFEEYGRVAREAARAAEKDVRLTVSADGAEVDRSVLVQLREPLLHLVRNAVVHGLETPAARSALGKPPTGHLRLEARCEGTRATIKVIDDGAGIAVERVRRKAVQAGLLDAQATLGAEELLEVLTRPGFSTRDEADELSGRGIGLDVVAARVKALAGTLAMESTPGRGTTFTIEVPVSASTSLGLVVRIGEWQFGILVNGVERVLRVGAEDVVHVEGRAMLRSGKELISMTSLGALLGLPEADFTGRRPAVLLREGRHRLVMRVDEIPGDQAFVVKPLGRAFARTRLVLGGAIQADGSVIPVLQAAELFALASGGARAAATSPAASEPAREEAPAIKQGTQRVLVVDDSLAMRTLLRGILQGAHYQVTVAPDGRAALEEYRRMEGCDLVVSDFQMPHLDGIQLCRAVRTSGRPHTPFIVVTSVGETDERKRALEAGADAWVIKADFEQGRFLELVQQLTGSARRS